MRATPRSLAVDAIAISGRVVISNEVGLGDRARQRARPRLPRRARAREPALGRGVPIMRCSWSPDGRCRCTTRASCCDETGCTTRCSGCPDRTTTRPPPCGARARGDILRPSGALARLDDVAVTWSPWQRTRRRGSSARPALVFAGDHGVAEHGGVSAYPTAVTAAMLAACRQGKVDDLRARAIGRGDARGRSTSASAARPATSGSRRR